MPDTQKFWTFDPVRIKGHAFDGVVRSAFTNKAGEWRYVVESDLPASLLIFNGDQLELQRRWRIEFEVDRLKVEAERIEFL
jgi:hypothetical protein